MDKFEIEDFVWFGCDIPKMIKEYHIPDLMKSSGKMSESERAAYVLGIDNALELMGAICRDNVGHGPAGEDMFAMLCYVPGLKTIEEFKDLDDIGTCIVENNFRRIFSKKKIDS